MTNFKPTSDYEVYRGNFSFCTGLSWEEVDRQIEYEKELGVIEALGKEENPTYLCTHQKTYPPGFFSRGLLMNKYHNVSFMHVYINKDPTSKTFGNHFDDVNVLIVQAIGRMKYGVNDTDIVTLEPGDGILIPKYMMHEPMPFEPRVTFSFSWR